VLEDTMAKTPAHVRGLLDKVWPPALRRAREERDALEKRARAEGGNFKIAAWDWRYYSEKERKARYDLDEAEVRSYLALENVLEAAFDTAGRLFGIVFEERTDVPVYHEDVRAWEVKTKSGEHVGVFYGDYYARPSKRSGAWMSSYRGQHKLGGNIRPLVVNVMSVARGAPGTPTLLSFDDARTLFHELGHGLHGLLSDVTYPSLAMTNVLHDFVELPSQLYEHWLSEPEVLKKFALNAKTGKPIPERLLKQLHAARTFNQGFQTVEYTASTLLDLELHSLSDTKGLDVDAFESEILARIGMPAEITPRHRIPHFQHIIGGYAAGYYSYLWSEVMDADAFAAFKESGNIFDRKTANKLKTHIYSAGNRKDALDAYVAFRGRPPEIDGLLKKRGLS
jgi:peptidyl-dipeptidase Dcp